MTARATEQEAAEAFLAEHGRVFGGAPSGPGGQTEVRLMWSEPAREGRDAVFSFRQRIRGKEVDGSCIRVKVREGALCRVNYAAAKVAAEPSMGSESPLVPAAIAIALVTSSTEYGPQTIVGEPELVVLRGSRTRPDAWCWRVRARTGGGEVGLHRVFYVDTALPRVLHVRQDFWNFTTPPTTGTVESQGTPASYPWYPYGVASSLVTHRIPGIRVNGTTGSASGYAFTNGNGEFTMTVGPDDQPITLEISVNFVNQWYRVVLFVPPVFYMSDSESATTGDDVPLVLANAGMSEEYRVAQTDTVVTANRGRNFFTQYVSSSATGLSYPLYITPSEISFVGTCNAGANVGSGSWGIAFGPAGGGCWNFGSHAVAAHEYGHIALFMLDDFEGFFHEGYADTFANMLNDDSVQGRSHFTNGNNVREDPTASGINCQYPISGNTSGQCVCDENHKAGQLLSGPWVRIRNDLKTSYGSSSGLEHARLLFGLWSNVTLGGDEDCEAAHPGTLVEALSVTENLVELTIICNSFAAHNITCSNCCP